MTAAETVVAHIRLLADGNLPHAHNAPEVRALEGAIRTLHADAAAREHLGLLVLGELIDRYRSSFRASEALHRFIRGEG